MMAVGNSEARRGPRNYVVTVYILGQLGLRFLPWLVLAVVEVYRSCYPPHKPE